MEHIPEKNTSATRSELLQFREENISMSSVLPHGMSYHFLHIVDG